MRTAKSFRRGVAWASFWICAVGACADRPPASGSESPDAAMQPMLPDAAVAQPTTGSFALLTYNVAGLPEGVSGSHPATNTPQMSPLLNAFDLALVQEDFNYHQALAASALHPYQSTPSGGAVGDGLNTFSKIGFTGFERVTWSACNGYVDAGNDCLAPKGFTVATFEVAPGLLIDIYDLHMDAGRAAADRNARQQQVQQLLAFISGRAPDRAILIAGDTNMKATDEAVLQELLTGASLTDACRMLGCPEPDLIDRVLVRSSSTLQLDPMSWHLDASFVDSAGDPLSDHDAVAVTIAWSSR